MDNWTPAVHLSALHDTTQKYTITGPFRQKQSNAPSLVSVQPQTIRSSETVLILFLYTQFYEFLIK
jgi:hypothetical protein